MTTANEIITQAAEMIGAHSTVKPLNPNSRDRMFDGLIQLIEAWEGVNITLGVTIPTVLSDDLLEPSYSTLGIIANLAVQSAPRLRLKADLEVIRLAKQERTLIQGRVSPTPQQSYKDSTPLGQGNKQWPGRRQFFPIQETIEGESIVNIISEGS